MTLNIFYGMLRRCMYRCRYVFENLGILQFRTLFWHISMSNLKITCRKILSNSMQLILQSILVSIVQVLEANTLAAIVLKSSE